METLENVENNPGWVKSKETKAVLNSDLAALNQYKINKQKNIQVVSMQTEVGNLKNEISNIKSDVSDIKNLLLQILNNTNK